AGLLRVWGAGPAEAVMAPPPPPPILAQQPIALALPEGGIRRPQGVSLGGGGPPLRARAARGGWGAGAPGASKGERGGEAGLGRQGQDSYGRKNFLELFSVFTSPPEFTVLYGKQELGSVHELTFMARHDEGPVVLLLAGRSWRLTHLDWKRRQAFVEPNDRG